METRQSDRALAKAHYDAVVGEMMKEEDLKMADACERKFLGNKFTMNELAGVRAWLDFVMIYGPTSKEADAIHNLIQELKA